ncbi:unnamed protein product [Darwinula stevensoni]|uniref:RING-type domain-containing protein n=1 Tax=Darwinula stevensoni TaxID=69355 RepID=A0A7R9FSW3_9CRUS|nr:unnamed protein product [Darwinula stevensoni]CAG0904363.1 unnamed protein product [Darwinula stevensoni]
MGFDSEFLSMCRELFPEVVLLDWNEEKYARLQGYLHLSQGEVELCLDLRLPLAQSRIRGCWKARQFLFHSPLSVGKILEESSSPHHLLQQLHLLLREGEKALNTAEPITRMVLSDAEMLRDVETKIGWSHVTWISPDFRDVHLECRDPHGRRHELRIRNRERVHVELPGVGKRELPWKPGTRLNLKDTWDWFVKEVEGFQVFWDAMEELDERLWILDPPSRARLSVDYRRFAAGPGLSIQMVVKPEEPRALPALRFLGPDHLVSPLRDTLHSRLHEWKEEKGLVENLETVLGRELPSGPRDGEMEVETNQECGICYSYRLGDAIPEKSCNEPRCGRPFHTQCLIDWLLSVPSCRQSLNMIFGECPYCNKVSLLSLM